MSKPQARPVVRPARAPRSRDRTIPAARFKAECLALLDDVAETRRGIVVTKRGKPVARVVPLDAPADALAGSIVWQKDIVEPLGEPWDSES